MDSRHASSVMDVRCLKEADVETGRILVRAKINLEYRSKTTTNLESRYNGTPIN